MLVHTQDSHWSLGFPANFLLSDFKHLMTDVWILESYKQKSVIILHPEGQVDYMFSSKYMSREVELILQSRLRLRSL